VNAFWSYFWPLLACGLILGALFGTIALRKRRLWLSIVGAILALTGATLWNGPLGAADRLESEIERTARAALVSWEMPQVQAHLHRLPLSRCLVLSGQADDFQRSELVRIMETIPGVTTATWSPDRGGIPLFAEAAIAAILGFLAGLLLAYVVELRRRYNAQWKW
jgi:membrane protease YdiL (CAAX protease family)